MTIVWSARDLKGARQRIGHMTVVGHPTNLDVWSVTIHLVLLVLQPANNNAGIRPCECWGNNNTVCSNFSYKSM